MTNLTLELVRKTPVQRINDVIRIPEILNEIEENQKAIGHSVRRGALGIVILEFPDGEVHFVPDGKVIWEFVYRSRGDDGRGYPPRA